MNKHTVVMFLQSQPGKEKNLLNALSEAAKLSLKEEACLEFRIHENIEHQNFFIVYETWASKEAHKAQFEKPYIKNLADQLSDILAQPFAAYYAREIETHTKI